MRSALKFARAEAHLGLRCHLVTKRKKEPSKKEKIYQQVYIKKISEQTYPIKQQNKPAREDWNKNLILPCKETDAHSKEITASGERRPPQTRQSKKPVTDLNRMVIGKHFDQEFKTAVLRKLSDL